MSSDYTGNPFSSQFVGPFTAAHVFKSQVRTFQNWGEFVATVTDPSLTYWQKLGLLHNVFSVTMGRMEWDPVLHECPQYPEIERLRFLYEAADGHTSSLNLQTSYGHRDEPTFELGDRDSSGCRARIPESKARQRLAKKAFDVLSTNIFSTSRFGKDEFDRERREKDWFNQFVASTHLDLVMRFFQPNKPGEGIRNISRWDLGHSERTAIAFLLKLPKALWTFTPFTVYRESSRETEVEQAERQQKEAVFQAMVAERNRRAKVWIIEVLSELDQLDLIGEYLLELERPCVSKLTEIAMRSRLERRDYPVFCDRKVRDLREACAAGSPAAWLLEKRSALRSAHARMLVEWRAHDREQRRFQQAEKRAREIAEAEQMKAEAERKLKELAGK